MRVIRKYIKGEFSSISGQTRAKFLNGEVPMVRLFSEKKILMKRVPNEGLVIMSLAASHGRVDVTVGIFWVINSHTYRKVTSQ